jgi:hypothetical protein
VAAILTAPRAEAAGQISGRWQGQDRHDYCGAVGNSIGPNGVQDIHVHLSGLPRQAVTSARITGHGEHEWSFGAAPNQFAAVLLRKPGAATAELYFEPLKVETGREFCVTLRFADGSSVDVYLPGGKADPNLRMPGAGLAVKWVGQGRDDEAGLGPSVGPDGRTDVELTLSRLSPRDRVRSVLIETTTRPIARWAFGANPEGHHNAELYLGEKDSTTARLLFQPDRDLASVRLKVTVFYEAGKKDTATVVGQRTNPKAPALSAELPRIAALSLSSRWKGQENRAGAGRGDVHLELGGVPRGRPIAAAVLTDTARGVWAWRAEGPSQPDLEPFARPLSVRDGASPGTADLFFAPIRNESGSLLSLRLIFRDGGHAVGTIEGGACDPALTAPIPEATAIDAKPGDDLAGLVAKYGTVRLSRGEYRMTHPLVLTRPCALTGGRDATLVFAQGPDEPGWTAAIKIHTGGVTLQGFSVRFAGPVRWRDGISYGPAVIGTTDNFDSVPDGPKPNLVFDSLDLEGPPKSSPEAWVEATRLLRLRNASAGRITHDTLHGGPIEFFDGPWTITGNEYRGLPAGTFSPNVFAGHETHDLVVSDNRARPIPGGGKTWRFLVLTNRSAFDRVENNIIEGIGPRDDDTIPSQNAPEIILTESYHIRFEGKPAAISADRRLVKVPKLPGEPVWPGDVVAVVAGKNGSAGAWRQIVQRIEPNTYLLDDPLQAGSEIVSITPGFVREVFAGNLIDARGGSGAAGLVLAGNHYGSLVRGNHVRGAGEAMNLLAYPSETPSIWGWSHAPCLGAVVEGNTFEDSLRGATLGVLHSASTKSNKDRVYMTLALKGNTVRWSAPFLKRTPPPAAGITLGYPMSIDPGELVVAESGDRVDAPASTAAPLPLKVYAAIINRKAVTDRAYRLPAAAEAATEKLGTENNAARR